MLTLREILWGVVYPLLAAAVVMGLAHLPWRRATRTQPWGPALALAVGFTLAYTAVLSRPVLRPVTVQGWLIHLSAASVVIAAAATWQRTRKYVVPAASIVVIAATPWLLQPAHRRSFTFAAAVFVAMLIWWAVMEALARRRAGAALPALLAVVAAGAALVLVDSGVQTFGQLAGAIAVVLTTFTLAAFWFRNLSLAHGGVLTLTVLLPGLILLGHLLADLTLRDLIILYAAPLALWAGELPWINRRMWSRVLVCAIAMLAVLLLALVPAVKGLHKTMTEQTEYLY